MGPNLTKNERIALKKQQGLLKDRHSRKLEKFSDRFNEMFFFFLNAYRKGVLNFSGSFFETYQDNSAYSARETFRRFDNGQYTGKALSGKTKMGIECKQSNILYAVITAKKSWGLHVKMWCEGIAERNFTIEEVVDDFSKKGLKIPEPLMNEFNNAVKKAKLEWLLNDWEQSKNTQDALLDTDQHVQGAQP